MYETCVSVPVVLLHTMMEFTRGKTTQDILLNERFKL